MGWIDDILNFLSNPKAAIQKIHDVIASMWSTITTLLTIYLKAFAWAGASALNMAHGAIDLGSTLPNFLWWLVWTFIPRQAGHALAVATDLANSLWRDATNLARGLFNDAVNLARSLANDLWTWAKGFYDWVSGQVKDIINTLTWTFNLVKRFLVTPDELAKWLLQPLWTYGVGWIRSNEVALGRWFMASAIKMVLAAASELESVIVRIL